MCDDGDVAPALVADVRAAVTFATDAATEAATFAFRSLGARALHDENPVQRYFRDINAAAQHAYVANTTYEDLARQRISDCV